MVAISETAAFIDEFSDLCFLTTAAAIIDADSSVNCAWEACSDVTYLAG